MQISLFENAITEEKTGFRLQRVEVYNWGTFHHRVWKMEAAGANSLLTGDIGSGKSTLVDALTTLLVPHHKIVYNKAAGAEGKERTLASYVRGEYKNQKDENNQAAKAVALRERNSYSVLLAHFHNEGLDQGITLAQVFWLKDQSRQVERFFVFSEKALSITEHFCDFGKDLLDLKKRLRQQSHTRVHDTFKEYGTDFRSAFGIQQEQALELFYQTISLKTVGNLTEFIRTHMLEKGDAGARIEELKKGFENLSRAHDAILEAREQIEILSPIADAGARNQEIEKGVEKLMNARESLGSFFASVKLDLLEKKEKTLQSETEKLEGRLKKSEEEKAFLARQEFELRESIRENGGSRLESLQSEIDRLSSEIPPIQKKSQQYEQTALGLNLPPAANNDVFVENRKATENALKDTEESITAAREEELNAKIEFSNLKEQCSELEKEISSLKLRRSSIPVRNLELRRRICQDLELSESQIPFAGELIQVNEDASAWRGAIERVLRSFALSLVVPEDLYPTVSKYVDHTHLRGKLVYFRARPSKGGGLELQQNSLVKKLMIKPDTPLREWLRTQLSERFDYACCERIEDFHALPFALTQNGQLKTGGSRHEKDDRADIHDRTQYVLGWENSAKIQALGESLSVLADRAADRAVRLQRCAQALTSLNSTRDRCRDLLAYTDFKSLDWKSLAIQLENLVSEKESLEKSSDQLAVLRAKLDEVVQLQSKNNEAREKWLTKKGSLNTEIKQALEQKTAAGELASSRTPTEQDRDFPLVRHFWSSHGLKTDPFLHELDRVHSDLRGLIQAEIDKEKKRSERLREDIIRRMQDFIKSFPTQAKDMDANIASLDEFNALLQVLNEEDLPRHEEKFRKLLNEGAINGIALFRNQLEKEAREIENKIVLINKSLAGIEYSAGTYIELVCDRTLDTEIRQFLTDLKSCTEHGVLEDSVYDEVKFLRVKQIMDRFNGRENLTEADRRWTAKVTDVRNWYVFSARESFTETGAEKEFYSDSSGKSGGQKEKLAYTVLASALAYQFGLEWNTKKSRTFRFVIIDEAFGRGSDESARFGLELFRKLNLQLLVVTPLQKIHIIENYVNSVHFVHNEGGRDSQVRSLTIEEYREQKQRRQSSTGKIPEL